MKLTKRAAVILACTALAVTSFVGCKGDDDKEDVSGDGDGDGDGDTGEGDGDGDVGGDGDGDGDGDTGDGDGDGPGSPYQCDTAGGAQCTGSASGIACADGTTDGVPFTCAQGEQCVDGACTGICEPGATECVAGAVQRVCTADGRSWVTIPCQSGQVCEDGACGLEGGLVCVPGSMDCDGNTARTCMDDGSGWDEMECPAATVCEEGACEGTVCTVGATRCDPASIPSADTIFEGPAGEFSPVIQTCVDGSGWVTSSCESTEEVERICSYTNIDASVAARYRSQVNSWAFRFQAAMNSEPSEETFFNQLALFPDAPAIPAGAKAACVDVPDDEYCNDPEDMFFEAPSMTRDCVDTDGYEGADGEHYEFWKGYSECHGIAPFAPPQVVNNECAGLTGCFWDYPAAGCQPTTCLPGETICSDEDGSTSYQTCYYDWSSSYFEEPEDCPDDTGTGGVAPAACTDGGDPGSRAVSCGPTEIEGEIWYND